MQEGLDIPSLEEVYERYSAPVSRLCGRMFRDREKAKDAAQEVWVELVRSLPSFEGRSSFSTWLWSIARRTAWRYLGKEKRYTTRFLAELFDIRSDDGMDEMDRVPVEDRMAWIRLQCDDCLTGILHCLGDEDRFIYLLRVLGRLEYRDIAEVMELDEAAVRQRQSRSARKLQRFLESECTLYNPDGGCRCKLSAPIREADHEGEYRKVRELSRRILFLNAASTYHPPKDYWRDLFEGTSAGLGDTEKEA